ncbi:Fc receptor-like protein 5 [Hyperolius riggenbachi]|uniref:Fc receptor-like protein 5 n=1 Tax=Hyperolius riggenbachi TaxID=752182 RepID=UPI0035A33D9E
MRWRCWYRRYRCIYIGTLSLRTHVQIYVNISGAHPYSGYLDADLARSTSTEPAQVHAHATYNHAHVAWTQYFYACTERSRLRATTRPVVTFSPNINKIFQQESITMTCNVEMIAKETLAYYWYRDGNWVQTRRMSTIPSAKKGDSGDYHCWTSTTGRSDSLRLEVSDGWVILQAPHYVHEGDDLSLRCRHYPGYDIGQTIFYKDGAIIQDWGYDDEFHINNVDVKKDGKYTCTKEVFHLGMYIRHTDETYISVQELFSDPEIKVTLSPAIGGDRVILTCATNLSLLREEKALQFAFYRNGRNVQGFGMSHQHAVQSVHLKDSGNYSCEVMSFNNSVKKQSKEIPVFIQELFHTPDIAVMPEGVTEGDHMTLSCSTNLSQVPQTVTAPWQFAFYKDGGNVQYFSSFRIYEVYAAQLKDSGNYSCEVKINNVQKRSDELNVIIKDVFHKPNIIVLPYPVMEGDNITLICDTRFSPHRQTTQLQFAFYRDRYKVQRFSLSHKYGIPFAQLKDSGKYSCKAKASTMLVKTSEKVFIQVNDAKYLDFSLLNFIRLSVSGIVLINIILLLYCGTKRGRTPRLRQHTTMMLCHD